ncbi:unnamed protein product [Urochloa decumbens]|uniref:Wall-associated receptor kinase galacturonan-binding domain-containing protein n=1 Tax=Urochloa decumbens TaxID=240449 RepID=A0ABC8ZLK5_9POAL
MAPLLLLLPALLLLAAADAFPASCSNATCGVHDIHYPFRLDSASDCGYPGLVLVCENNSTLILPVKSHRYRVFSIDYGRHTVSVFDADADDGEYPVCPRLHVNLTIDYASSWLQPAPSDSNITFLYNCKKNASWSSAVELIGCQADGDKRSYVLPDGVATGAEAYEYECEEVVVAPVLGVHKARMVPGSPAPANGSVGVGDVVRAGFELMYNAHSPQCDGCERSGGWCGYRHDQMDADGMELTCFCDSGPAADRCGEGPSATPVIRLAGENYTVQSISYDSRTIILTDSDVLIGGSCPVVHHDVSFDSVWLHNTSYNDNLTFHFGCYSRDPVPPAFDKYQIDPAGDGDGASFVFTPDNHDRAQEQDLAVHCNDAVSVPVRSDVLMATNQNNFTRGGYGDVLKQGFELAWSMNNEQDG